MAEKLLGILSPRSLSNKLAPLRRGFSFSRPHKFAFRQRGRAELTGLEGQNAVPFLPLKALCTACPKNSAKTFVNATCMPKNVGGPRKRPFFRLKREIFSLERRWLSRAHSYEFAERLSDFSLSTRKRSGSSRVKVFLPRPSFS